MRLSHQNVIERLINIRTIAIVYDKERKPDTEVAAKEAIDYIKKFCNVTVNPHMYNIGINAVIVFGGDGTLLRVANRVANCDIPIIGVNYGNVGYLCKLGIHELINSPTLTTLDRIINGDYTLEQRTRIAVEITHKEGISEHMDALNEIVIGGITRTVYLKLFIESMYGYQKSWSIDSVGDGIIFSTKTGSTAYNVSAGGPILLMDAFSVVLNNKSRIQSEILPESAKSFITDIDTQFRVEIPNTNKENLPYIICDGQRDLKLTGTEKIRIKKSMFDTKFIQLQ